MYFLRFRFDSLIFFFVINFLVLWTNPLRQLTRQWQNEKDFVAEDKKQNEKKTTDRVTRIKRR